MLVTTTFFSLPPSSEPMTLQHSLLISPSLSFMASLRTQSWASNHLGPRSLHLSFYAISANSSIVMSLYLSSLGGGWGVTFNCCIISNLQESFKNCTRSFHIFFAELIAVYHMKVGWRHRALLLLNSSMCIS